MSDPHFESPSAFVFVPGSTTKMHKIIGMTHRFNIKYQALLIPKISLTIVKVQMA
jgi:hypothetical protein